MAAFDKLLAKFLRKVAWVSRSHYTKRSLRVVVVWKYLVTNKKHYFKKEINKISNEIALVTSNYWIKSIILTFSTKTFFIVLKRVFKTEKYLTDHRP